MNWSYLSISITTNIFLFSIAVLSVLHCFIYRIIWASPQSSVHWVMFNSILSAIYGAIRMHTSRKETVVAEQEFE